MSDASFNLFSIFNNLSIKNSEYAFLIRLDLRVPIVRNFQFDLSIKHVIKLILYDNDTNLLKIKRSPIKIDLRYI